MKDFAHLHVHSEYSLLDGFSRLPKLIDKAKKLGMSAIALTDHGSMFGVVDFYKEAKKKGIKPIIGCEVYVAQRTILDKDPSLDKYSNHLILLAENQTGYQNLIKLVSTSYVEGFYYKPRVDKDLLRKYSEGIIALSACLAGEIPRALMHRNYNKAKNVAVEFKEIFGKDNFFIELQDHGLAEQKEVNRGLLQIARELEIGLVATNDVHYVEKEDAKSQDILMCISTGKTIYDDNRMKMPNDNFYLKSGDEMSEIFPGLDEVIDNSLKIAQRCRVDFDFDTIHLPDYKVPEGYSAYSYLKELCEKGLYERYGDKPDKEIKDRLAFELKTIKDMGYVEYFLIVWDFIRFAKENEIMVGPGRGSAAGSIVAYTLHITELDPIKYSLIFERFLNPERVSMPDIDIDFCYERREEVIDYVKRKYGSDHVAQIITFGTMGAKGAIRDVGRVLDIQLNKVDNIAKEVPDELNMTIIKAMEKNPNLKAMYESDEETKVLIDNSLKIEGMLRHASTHAAGVVISKTRVDDYVPLYRHQDSVTTQFPMTTLEELGLLKMDFLGLRTLTVIRDTLDLIEKNREKMGYTEIIDFSKSNFDDPEVYKLLSSAKTLGVFQLESSGMRNFMKQLRPSNFEDIIAGISLFRPGPMDSIPTYIANKNDPSKVEYLDEQLRPILDVTYGCLVYQEQVMEVVRKLAGYSYGRSDQVRRAMSKKKMDIMEEERQYFIYGKYDDAGEVEINGCLRNGVDESAANKIYDEMIDFAKYAFNKSHAAAYGVLAYETAYLKAHYPVEFMAALLTSVMNNTDKVVEYLRDCQAMGIEVEPPHVNEGQAKFSVDGRVIKFGLSAIKNLGIGNINALVEQRKVNGPYLDIEDYVRRLNGNEINKRAVESLIKAGAFDGLNYNRATMLANFEDLMGAVSKDKKKNIEGQISLFDNMADDNSRSNMQFNHRDELDKAIILDMEREVLGLYISGHPLAEYEDEILKKTSINLKEINENRDNLSEFQKFDDKNVVMGGMVIYKRVTTTKKGELMAFVTIEDLYGTIDVVVFPKLFNRYSKLLKEYAIVYIKGRLNVRNDTEISLVAEDIVDINDSRDINASIVHDSFSTYGEIMKPKNLPGAKAKKLYIKIDTMENKDLIAKIIQAASGIRGEDSIILYPEDENKNGEKKAYKIPNLNVMVGDILLFKLKQILDETKIAVV